MLLKYSCTYMYHTYILCKYDTMKYDFHNHNPTLSCVNFDKKWRRKRKIPAKAFHVPSRHCPNLPVFGFRYIIMISDHAVIVYTNVSNLFKYTTRLSITETFPWPLCIFLWVKYGNSTRQWYALKV